MYHSKSRQASTGIKAKADRQRLWLIKREAVSLEREAAAERKRRERVAWWQRTFRAPVVVGTYLWAKASSVWGLLMQLIGLSIKPRTHLGISRGKARQRAIRQRGLSYENLELRSQLAADLDTTIQATLASGNLTLLDTVGRDNIQMVSRSGSDLVITDESRRFISAPSGGTLSNSDRTLTIPLSSITGSLIVQGAGGNDKLTIDFAGGNPIPTIGIDFNGGVGGDDSLTLAGYSLTTADGVADVSVTHTTSDSGAIALTGLGTVSFDEIEPLSLTGTAADISITLPAGADIVTLGDDGNAQDSNGNTANTTALYDASAHTPSNIPSSPIRRIR